MKNDIDPSKKIDEKEQQWLNLEHLELTAQWFMRNIDSPLVDSFNVVQSQFTT